MSRNQTKKGFTLIEVVMALGAFTIIIMGTMQIMAQGAKSYRAMKAIQTNLETAQFALNLMAKELRTSSIVWKSLGANISTIIFFDYSQNRCIQYQANVTTGTVARRDHPFGSADPDANRSACSSYTFGETYVPLLSGLSKQSFLIDESTAMPSPHVGRVTVSLSVGTAATAATAQTTVSLRDFNFIGI